MSSKDFLKSVEGKLLSNKRKAEPDMRMDALLGCTSKRIRREIVRESRKEQVGEIPDAIENKCDIDVRAGAYNNIEFNSALIEDDFVDSLQAGLVSDPKQVELFLRQVETQPPLTNNKDIESISSVPSTYSFIEKSICLPEPILPGNPDIDLNLGALCANLESLYEDLLDSLVSVERWMNMASNENTEKVEKDQGSLSQDQQELMMDLSKVLGI